jgi:hypothetical protein
MDDSSVLSEIFPSAQQSALLDSLAAESEEISSGKRGFDAEEDGKIMNEIEFGELPRKRVEEQKRELSDETKRAIVERYLAEREPNAPSRPLPVFSIFFVSLFT